MGSLPAHGPLLSQKPGPVKGCEGCPAGGNHIGAKLSELLGELPNGGPMGQAQSVSELGTLAQLCPEGRRTNLNGFCSS